MNRRYSLIFLAVVALVLATVAVTRDSKPSSPPRSVLYTDRVGMGVSHDLDLSRTGVIEAEFRQLHAGGVSWVREDLTWALAEPQRGVFNWAPFDRLMEAASRAGMHVLGILDYSAPWASSDPTGQGNPFYPPTSDGDFAAYATAVASRYGSTGTFWSQHPELAPDPLSAVEIWNEPYGSWFWKPGPDPAGYAALVGATAPAIHAVDPQMQVIMSGDLQSWDDRLRQHRAPWIASVLKAAPGTARLVNAISVHPYPDPRELGPYDVGSSPAQAYGRVVLVRQAELNAGVTLPIWITEVGWSTVPRTRHAVSDAQGALFLRGAVVRAIGDWGSYVPRIFLFGWYRSSGIQGDPAHNYGLLDSNGVPKPAWRAITRLLGGKPASEPCLGCTKST